MKKSLPTLFLLVTFLLLTACSGGASENPVAVVSGGDDTTASPYQLLIASSDVTAVDNRVALTFWDGPDRFTDGQTVTVSIYLVDAEGTAGAKMWEGDATPYIMSDIQYWVVYPEFTLPGNYGIQTFLTTNDNQNFENRALLTVKEDSEAPGKGEVVPATDTLTLDDVSAIEELSSAGPYIEDFYRVNIEEATQNGKVSVISFATPGHCTSALCSPVLLSMSQVHDKMADADMNWVHIEIWRDFEQEYLDPAVTDWKLPSEPWVFILNEDGTVGARLDGPVSVEELEQAIQEVQNG
jgi:hypothetical protein